MMDTEKLKEELKGDEELRLSAYSRTTGRTFIGYGHDLEAAGLSKEAIDRYRVKGITREQAEKWLDEDIRKAEQVARHYFVCFEDLTEQRQRVVVSLCFLIGWKIGQFKKMVKAVEHGRYEEACKEMLKEKMASQIGKGLQRLVQMMTEE